MPVKELPFIKAVDLQPATLLTNEIIRRYFLGIWQHLRGTYFEEQLYRRSNINLRSSLSSLK